MFNGKRLPYDKTVVTEVKVHLADILSRSVRLKSSVATPVLASEGFNNGDITVTEATPFVIHHVTSIVILSSLEPFSIVLRQREHEVTLPCAGLFVHTGPAELLIVVPRNATDKIRLQYVWS